MSRGAAGRLAVVLLAALAARAVYGLAFPSSQPGPGGIPDPDLYVKHAIGLLDYGGLMMEPGRPSALREPGYPIFLAGILSVRRSYRAVLTAQCLAGTLGVWLIFLLGRELFDERVGLLSAAIAALYPPFIYYCAQVWRETVLTAWAAGALLALCLAYRKAAPRAYVLAGAVTALGPLTNSAFVPFAFAGVPLGVLWLHRRGARLLLLGAYLAGSVPLYGLWVARNAWHFHTLILGATVGGGGNFYTYQLIPPELAGTEAQAEYAKTDPVMRKAAGLDDVQLDKLMWREGLKLALRRPFNYLKMASLHFLKLWRPYPYRRSYEHSYRSLVLAGLASDGWILPFALLGVFLAGRTRPELLQSYLLLATTSALYSALWAMIRYRIPVMGPVIVLCAYAVLRCADRLRGGLATSLPA